jgi:ubiquinone biosynthesis monooxygenase Coq7
LETFRQYLAKHQVPRCKSYFVCGLGGYVLGFVTALMGKPGIMACTAAVETVVTAHLVHQMTHLRAEGDLEALQSVESIVADELEHREAGVIGGQGSFLYRPVSAIVSAATSFVIWLGMKL